MDKQVLDPSRYSLSLPMPFYHTGRHGTQDEVNQGPNAINLTHVRHKTHAGPIRYITLDFLRGLRG